MNGPTESIRLVLTTLFDSTRRFGVTAKLRLSETRKLIDRYECLIQTGNSGGYCFSIGGYAHRKGLAMIATVKPEVAYSGRIGRLREKLPSSPYEADAERARYTRSYRSTEGQSACLRAAKGLEETLRYTFIKIDEDELLVGAKTIKTVASRLVSSGRR